MSLAIMQLSTKNLMNIDSINRLFPYSLSILMQFDKKVKKKFHHKYSKIEKCLIELINLLFWYLEEFSQFQHCPVCMKYEVESCH